MKEKLIDNGGSRGRIIQLEIEEVWELCRPGAGADTCIWLVVGADGFECLYFNRAEGRNLIGETLEERWKAGKTVAKRDGCEKIKQLERPEAER